MVVAILTVALVAALAWLAWLAVERRRSLRSQALLQERLAAASRGLESLQQSFARFVPADVVESIIAQGVSTRSEKKDVTVLFADLKGFTSLAEGLDPDLLVRILNGYFERMSRAISSHRGHVAKFIGDGLLALFGALEPNPWQAADAVQAALAMRDALAEYNARLHADGSPPLAMGVGVHRGSVVAGVIGSTVNVAARVQQLTRLYDVDILVTADVANALDARFVLRALPPAHVKGVSTLLSTFAIEGTRVPQPA
jgi:class 3 adenylate cyclase